MAGRTEQNLKFVGWQGLYTVQVWLIFVEYKLGNSQHVYCLDLRTVFKKTGDNFHICALHPAVIKVFYYQLMHKRIVFIGVLTLTVPTWRIWWDPNNARKWQMGFNSAFKGLTFTLKLHLEHVSVWSPSSGSVQCELAKVTMLKRLVKIYRCG